MGTAVLEAHDLVVDRGRALVLRGVDMRVRAGEIVAVVGPNGAGKSTLLDALSGDMSPASGRIVLAGADITTVSHGDLARRRAVLPQHVTIAFPFTVEQVVRMGRWPWAGVAAAEDADGEAVGAAMAECDIEWLASRPYPMLSGGEQARVSLARVLAQRTQLLLLDEPTAALDLRHQEQVFTVLRRRAAAGDAVVIVLHDLTAAAANADRIVMLEDGLVAADGPPDQTLRPDLLDRVYGHRLDVFASPASGALVVVPHRAAPNTAIPSVSLEAGVP